MPAAHTLTPSPSLGKSINTDLANLQQELSEIESNDAIIDPNAKIIDLSTKPAIAALKSDQKFTAADLKGLKLKELQELCRSKNLPVKGSRAQLEGRLLGSAI